jgi:immune inhibitor A
MQRTQGDLHDLFFSTGKIAKGSVREYFTDVSNAKIKITGQVVGPYRLPRTLAAYAGGGSGTDNPVPNARTMARDAAMLANADVDFAPYDNDGNGFVDAFIVVHAGPGAEETGDGDHIWSHKWVLSGGAFAADGARIYAYLTVPENCRIGVCAHELGHLLFGWPDLYDVDETSEGLGDFCLMAGGSWNDGGDLPAHPSAWCKVNQGWVTVVTPKKNRSFQIRDVKTGKRVYRLWKDGAAGDEHFLVENRQRKGYDAGLPGAGLLIYHIDEAIDENDNENHPKVKLMEADGRNHLHDGSNRGDAGDPFPGTSGNVAFTALSLPSSKSYGGRDTCVTVTGIGAPAATMRARLGVQCGTAKPKKKKQKKKKPRTPKKSKRSAPARPGETTQKRPKVRRSSIAQRKAKQAATARLGRAA